MLAEVKEKMLKYNTIIMAKNSIVHIFCIQNTSNRLT